MTGKGVFDTSSACLETPAHKNMSFTEVKKYFEGNFYYSTTVYEVQ